MTVPAVPRPAVEPATEPAAQATAGHSEPAPRSATGEGSRLVPVWADPATLEPDVPTTRLDSAPAPHDAEEQAASATATRVADQAGELGPEVAPAEAGHHQGNGVPAPGQPLPPRARTRLEAAFGADLADVRIHDDAEADTLARRYDADAVTSGQDISFANGHYDISTRRGVELLAHEIAHVVEPASGAGTAGVFRNGPRTVRTLAPVITGLEQVDSEMRDLLRTVQNIDQPSADLIRGIASFHDQVIFAGVELRATRVVEDFLAGRVRAADVDANPPMGLSRVVTFYFPHRESAPLAERVNLRLTQLQRGLQLTAIMRARVVNLTRTPAGNPETAATRRIEHDLAARYLEAAAMGQAAAASRLAFLDTFFQDPVRLQGYGLAQLIRDEIPTIWQNLRNAMLPSSGSGIWNQPREGVFHGSVPISLPRDVATASGWAQQRVENMNTWATRIGPLPRSVDEVHEIPRIADIATNSRELRHAYAEATVIHLWSAAVAVSDLLVRYWSLIGVSQSERQAWSTTLYNLRNSFAEELSHADHPDFVTRVQRWQDTLTPIQRDLVRAVRRQQIATAIGEQLPLMIVAAATGLGAAAWAARAFALSRWVVPLTILAEGVAVTAVTTAAQLPSGRLTAGSVALDLAKNVAFAGVGRLVLGPLAGTAQSVSATRRLLVGLAAVPTLAGLQTAAQALEARVRNQGGETDWTQLLTVNMATSLLGLLFGATLQRARADAAAQRGAGQPVQTNQELARAAGMDDAAARAYAALADRTAELQALTARIGSAARQRTLSQADFDAWKSSANRLLDDLEAQLPGLARQLGLSLTDAEIAATVARYRGLLAAAHYDPSQPVRLLPEYTQGLTRGTGENTWLVDPGADPNAGAIGRLRASYENQPGTQVRRLPAGTGWEVTNSQGMIILQVIAGVPRSAPLLPPSVDALTAGDVNAQAAVAAVRRNSPTLEARIAQELVTPNAGPRVVRILSIAGRVAAAAPDATLAAPAAATPGELAAVRAIDAALSDAGAQTGLELLGRSRIGTSALLGVPDGPANMRNALNAIALVGRMDPAFYQALARDVSAQELVNRFGPQLLFKIINLRRTGDPPAIRLARSARDIDRVLRGLTDESVDLATRQQRLEQAQRLRALSGIDRVFGAAPPPAVEIEPVTTDPSWPRYQSEARDYALRHPPQGTPYTAAELRVRATLLQIVERARSGEFDRLGPDDVRALSDQFEAMARAARLEQGWINTRKAQLQEAAGSPGSRGQTIIWLNRQIVFRRVSGSTVPDGAFPPIRAGETPAERAAPRTWIEQKSHHIDEGLTDASGVFRRGRAAAENHLSEAQADLNDNLPTGSRLALDYLRDPGEPTRSEMLRILFREPRIVRVRFGGTAYERNGSGGFRVGTWGP